MDSYELGTGWYLKLRQEGWGVELVSAISNLEISQNFEVGRLLGLDTYVSEPSLKTEFQCGFGCDHFGFEELYK